MTDCITAEPIPAHLTLTPNRTVTRDKSARSSRPPPKTPRGGDRFSVLNAFVDQSLQSLKGAQVSVWLVLFRTERDRRATIGHAAMARYSGLSRRSTIRAVNSLIALGLVERLARGGPDVGPSTYRMLRSPAAT